MDFMESTEQTKNKIVQILNESGLPLEILGMIIENVLLNIKLQIIQPAKQQKTEQLVQEGDKEKNGTNI